MKNTEKARAKIIFSKKEGAGWPPPFFWSVYKPPFNAERQIDCECKPLCNHLPGEGTIQRAGDCRPVGAMGVGQEAGKVIGMVFRPRVGITEIQKAGRGKEISHPGHRDTAHTQLEELPGRQSAGNRGCRYSP